MNRPSSSPADDPARVLVVVDRPLLAGLVELTLNHGVYVTRDAKDVPEARRILEEWRPHLVVLDLDAGGGRALEQLGQGGGSRGMHPPSWPSRAEATSRPSWRPSSTAWTTLWRSRSPPKSCSPGCS